MSGVAIVSAEPDPGLPGRRPVKRIVIIVVWLIAAAAFANLVGWDIRGWCESVWDTVTGISRQYVIAGILLMTLKTTATAYAWYSILRYAYPGEVAFRVVFAAYATCVALNNVLPANLGTIVMFIMLTTVIASATFAGMIGGFLVQKIFFTIAACFVYLYLFLSVPGSFDISFSWVHENPWATAALVLGVAAGVTLLVHHFWPKVRKWWEQARDGGQILAHPRAYFGRVFLPEFIAWSAGLCITAVFMAAYDIPVTFHSVMSVTGSNSISNTVALTPGGAGVNQAFNVAALKDVTDSTTATAFSLSQQLISTAWSIIFAVVLLIWVFGWAGGKALVSESYSGAKVKVAEQKAAREAAKSAQEAGRSGNPQGA
jgi:uncharacterized membrane protein YbhN (UPF0104 family)